MQTKVSVAAGAAANMNDWLARESVALAAEQSMTLRAAIERESGRRMLGLDPDPEYAANARKRLEGAA